MKDTLYIGLRDPDGAVRVLKDGKTALRPVGSNSLFADPRGLDWSKGNQIGQRLLATSILYDFIEDEKQAEALAPSFAKRFLEDLDDRGYHMGWTLLHYDIYEFLGMDQEPHRKTGEGA